MIQSRDAFLHRPPQGTEVMWLRVPMRVSEPHWVAEHLSPLVENGQGRLSVVVSAVELAVPVCVGDLIDAVAAGKDHWADLDLTIRRTAGRAGERDTESPKTYAIEVEPLNTVSRSQG